MTDTIDDKITKAKKAVDEYLSKAGEEIGQGNIDIALRIIDVAKRYTANASGYGTHRIEAITTSAYSAGVENSLERMRQYAQQRNFAKAGEEAAAVKHYADKAGRDVKSEIEEAVGFWYDHSYTDAASFDRAFLLEHADEINELLAFEKTNFRIGPGYHQYGQLEYDDSPEVQVDEVGIYTQSKKNEGIVCSLANAWKEFRIKKEKGKR